MKLLRYREDIAPVIVACALFIGDLAVYFFAERTIVLFVWFLLVILPKCCLCSFNHHHQHLPTFYSRTLNRILELLYALHTGITTNAWVLHHNLGHHLHYLDQSRDESGWKRKSGRIMGEIEYTLAIAITGYLRAFQVGMKHPKYLPAFLGMGSLVLALVALMTWHHWLNALIVFILPMTIGYFVTCWHTYSHHAGLDSNEHLHASHNIMHRWYNILTGNLGFHTAHHMKPGLHWSQLPEHHATIAHEIPKELFVKPPLLFRILLPSAEC